MGHDLLRTLGLGGLELIFESRAVPVSGVGVGRTEVSEGIPGCRERERLRKPSPRGGRDPAMLGSHVGKEQKVGQSSRKLSVKLTSRWDWSRHLPGGQEGGMQSLRQRWWSLQGWSR